MTGQWFYGGRLGIGLGVGASFDQNGKRPGAEKGACGAGTTVGTFGDFGGSFYNHQLPIDQYAGGIDISSGETYSEGPTLGGGLTIGNGVGFDIGGSFGVEVIGHN